ncbi:Pre protein translocase subunit Sec66-domain-containing protein [Leucosporidium creatinivorum]|uniref:Pre protein translocase subunit Sec66-domain-containing protein n=1 Tax=Leucosporidium creatinivorum TaxID=106004 RepID=A0A1Y2F3H3_9BASI|nr:Pre protein translocase subunit Sec66-domain-containing protein [Leucosporidium creatinivorum]
MVSVLVPLSYVVFLFGSLAIFSRYYRANQSKKQAAPPWFPKHKSRDIYISLLSLDPPPPRPILIAALLRRAMDDIGDDLWERFQVAEKELEAEIVEVVGEANTFQEGYGQQVFGIASEMVSHERWKEVYEKIGEKRKVEEARLTSPLPTLALSPNQHLTPSSLTLSPSNPLPTAASLTTSPSPAPAPTPTAAPLTSTQTTSTPPPPSTPLKKAPTPATPAKIASPKKRTTRRPMSP